MKCDGNLQLDGHVAPGLETAIEQWLAARGEYQKHALVESESRYNETYFALGAAWAERHPDAAHLPGAFETFRRGLISSDTEE